MRQTEPGDYVVVLRPLPGHRNDAGRRMALLLKHALRHLHLKCIDVRPDVPAKLDPPPVELDVEKTEPPFAPREIDQ